MVVRVTVNVTGSVMTGLDAPAALTVIAPLNVPSWRPEQLTETVSEEGILPLAGAAESQLADEEAV